MSLLNHELLTHELLTWAAKSVGLFYFLALSLGVVAYACWPGSSARFDAAARGVFEDRDIVEEKTCRESD